MTERWSAALLLAALLVALACLPGSWAGVDNCAGQDKCLDWSISGCVNGKYTVCMKFNLGGDCAKQGPEAGTCSGDTFSHACAGDYGILQGTGANYTCNTCSAAGPVTCTPASDTIKCKVDGVKHNTEFCTTVEPDEDAEFVVKDGVNSDVCGTFTSTTAIPGTSIFPSCGPPKDAAGAFINACRCNPATQLSQCIWKVRAPETCGTTPTYTAPSVTKTADRTQTDTYSWTVDKTGTANPASPVQVGTDVDLSWDIEVERTGPNIVYGTVSGTISVVNPNTNPFTLSGITDALSDGTTCLLKASQPTLTLPVQTAAVNYEYQCDGTSTNPLTNTATAAYAAVGNLAAGSVSTGAVSVTNTLTEVNKCADIKDTYGSSTITLANKCTDGKTTYTYPAAGLLRVMPTAGCTDYPNTAFVDIAGSTVATDTDTISVCAWAPLTVSKTGTYYKKDVYDWTVTKTASPTTAQSIRRGGTGATISYTVTADLGAPTTSYEMSGTITATNTNPVDVDVSFSDLVTAGGSTSACAVKTEDVSNTIYAPTGGATSATATADYSCSLSAVPTMNKARVDWDAVTVSQGDLNGFSLPQGYAEYTLDGTDGKTIQQGADQTVDARAGLVDTFPTSTAGLNVAVTAAGLGSTAVSLTADTTKSPSITVTATNAATAGRCTDLTNTVTLTESDTNGEVRTASVTNKVCVYDLPTVTKTATLTTTTPYTWTVTKTVSPTSFTGFIGAETTVQWNITITRTRGTISKKVAGTITVTNPNTFIVPVTWEDTLRSDSAQVATCASGTTTVDVPAAIAGGTSGTKAINYECTSTTGAYDTATNNRAVVTWAETTFATDGTLPAGHATTTPDVSLTGASSVPVTVDRCATLVDMLAGSAVTLPAPATRCFDSCTDAVCSESILFTRTVTVADYPAPTCADTTNVVTLTTAAGTGTGATSTDATATASAKVTVCRDPDSGALSHGFWGNNNGEKVILGAGVVSGSTVCRLTVWLQQFLQYTGAYTCVPILSSTATCAQVVAYVKATSSNTFATNNVPCQMLHAQEQAVLLDMYFSDPDLGWKDSLAEYKLKKVTLANLMVGDLSKYGSGTTNAAQVLGGTCLSVLDIATSASNNANLWTTGTTNKAAQTAVKDVFDKGIINDGAPIYAPGKCPTTP